MKLNKQIEKQKNIGDSRCHGKIHMKLGKDLHLFPIRNTDAKNHSQRREGKPAIGQVRLDVDLHHEYIGGAP